MKKCAIISALALSGFLAANGQAIQEPYKVKVFGDREAAENMDVYSILNANAPGDLAVAGVPYFTTVGREGKFVVGAGGYAKAVAGWDIGHPIASPDEFITSQIPMEDPDGDGSRFNLSARQTMLYLNFVMLPGSENQVGAFVGANFLDESYKPTVQYAYLRYRGLEAGYANTLFADQKCAAPSVDYEGPCSNTCSPVGAVNYRWEKGPWMVGGGLQLPQASFTVTEGKTKAVTQRMPDLPLAAKYSWNRGDSWVRASAVLRTLTWRDLQTLTNHNCLGYGFQLSGAEQFLDRFTVFYQGVWGKGIASMLQDTSGEGLDLTPCMDGDGLTAVPAWGGFIAIQCKVCSKVLASVTYSHLRTYVKKYTDGDNAWDDLYKYAQYLSANIFYDPTPYFEIGVENIWGRRTNYSGLHCADNRIQASVQFTF